MLVLVPQGKFVVQGMYLFGGVVDWLDPPVRYKTAVDWRSMG
jgi:hypothetical protein